MKSEMGIDKVNHRFWSEKVNVSRLGCPSKTLGSIPLGRCMNHTILLVDSLLVGTDCDVNVHVLAQRQTPSHMHSFQDEVEAANDTISFFHFTKTNR